METTVQRGFGLTNTKGEFQRLQDHKILLLSNRNNIERYK